MHTDLANLKTTVILKMYGNVEGKKNIDFNILMLSSSIR